ncbi:toll/interleukin-1 receptor domain-containing protein [Lysobacter sp. A6]|uniref:Toll/interleukin-1 receptor domain-containing protein n=1 Tax=Noviluteimonas lactosilytica TaxID=2888523 RepID=A0ABS8JGV3_9GAMM|nr:toll/interleukin-1 receptor domain-containing protein [Lysobacter lactosilyticus]
MKVFISHKQEDAAAAQRVAHRLKAQHSIECYLDVIDPYVGGSVERLADHIRAEMGKCTQLLAVVSTNTAYSQWVPWEIGVATEKDFPLATYAADGAMTPEFLRKWPYLKNEQDLDAYARVSKQASAVFAGHRRVLNESLARSYATKDFYRDLRRALGQ